MDLEAGQQGGLVLGGLDEAGLSIFSSMSAARFMQLRGRKQAGGS